MNRSLGVLLALLWSVNVSAQQTVVGERLKIADEAELSGTVGHPDYVSQLTTWQIDALGAGDFRYLFTDELHAKSFIADLEQALAGGQIIAKSVAMVGAAFTNPAAGGSATLTIRDLPSAENMAAFESGDIVALRTFSRASGSLTIADSYGTVTGYADAADGLQTWTFTRGSGSDAGTMGAASIVPVDSIAIDFGTTGNGYHEINAIDGIYGLNSPYSQVVTWATSPIAANRTVRSRIGNLRGITGTTGEYGAILGTYAATGGQYVRVSNQAVELHGVNLQMWDGATNVIKLDRTAPSFAIGSPVPSAYGTGTGIWMGNDGGTYKFRVGDPSANRVQWDGSTLTIVGTVTATSGTIGGWTLGLTSLTAGSGSTTVGLDSGGTNPAIYAGSATPGSAPFRVTTGGAVTASSGTIGGWALGATSLTAGSGATTVGLDSGGTNPRIYIGSSTPGSAPFRVTAAGALTATNATLTGSLSAGGGDVVINSSGISIAAGSSTTNAVSWTDGTQLSSLSDLFVILATSGISVSGSGTTMRYASGALYPLGGSDADLGRSGEPWDELYVRDDIYFQSPPDTTADDYPLVHSSGNGSIWRKTDGFNGVLCSGSAGVESITVERGLVISATCF